MVVQHNLTAMNSNRMLGITTGAQAKSTEKLSSGYKINRAADDAAGLSISEKMRKQIRGLTQASLNAQDGISAVQTAEGALTEVHDMLQRMNELAVKASNGTMSENDRSYIQNEIDQLVTEIDRVAETTKFNETYLLKGNGNGVGAGTPVTPEFTDITTNKPAAIVGQPSAGTAEVFTTGKLTQGGTTGAKDTVVTVEYLDKNGELKSKDITFASAAAAAGSATNLKDALNADSDLNGLFTATGNENGIVMTAKTAGKNQGRVMSVSVKTPGADTVSMEAGKQTTAAVDSEKQYNIQAHIGTDGNTITIGDKTYTKVGADPDASKGEFTDFASLQAAAKKDGYLIEGTETAATFKKQETILELKLHVGADSTSNNQIKVNISSMDAGSLGLKTGTTTVDGKEFATLQVNGTDDKNALAAINTISAAIQKVSTQRSALGAVQNRLEHTINNLDNVVENTTAAESQIRDTDMAKEMVKYSNNNILAQAGQAMLAQANQANQGVLSLLG